MVLKQRGNAEVGAVIFGFIGLLLAIFIYREAKELGVDVLVLLKSVGLSVLFVGAFIAYLIYQPVYGGHGRSFGDNFLLGGSILLVFLWPSWWPVLEGMSLHNAPKLWDASTEVHDWYASGWFEWIVELAFISVAGWRIFK